MAQRLPPLTRLRAFEAAARLGSFKAAASELCVTQAAVSHQIKALELDLGQPLFHRTARAVHLAERARPLAGALTEAFDRMAEATEAFAGPRMEGRLRISVAPFFGNRWLLPRLGRFHERYPGLEVEPVLSFDVVDIAGEGFDAAVRYGHDDWPGLATLPVFRDRVGPVAAPQLVAGCDLPLSAGALAGLPLAATRRWRGDWPAWFAAAGLDGAPGATIDYDSRAFAFDAALSGNAVCLADMRMTASDEANGRLVRLHPLTVERPQGIQVVHPGIHRPDPRVVAFADWLSQEAHAQGPYWNDRDG